MESRNSGLANNVNFDAAPFGEDVSFAEMSRLQQKLAAVVGADPDVAGYSSTVGAGIGGHRSRRLHPAGRAVAAVALGATDRVEPERDTSP